MHPGADIAMVRRLVFGKADVRIVVQEIAEDFLAIDRVFHRVENMVVPEDVDIGKRCHLFVRVQFHQA
ncbi:hypothetical protein CR105_20930 [Massilia eurypsychrophila]|uniref:Uncharacterized protein n=1 Tax=Massilia eurypsychrophila TaxID=1485217 RepID=A0A2G8TAM4_9BURK|nr:hypothetical protein CR105_20930 [Massilia eurypsychrophila]